MILLDHAPDKGARNLQRGQEFKVFFVSYRKMLPCMYGSPSPSFT